MNAGDPISLLINAAVTSLITSDIPFSEPCGKVWMSTLSTISLLQPSSSSLAAVRIGWLEDGTVVVNPTPKQLQQCKSDLLYAGTRKGAVLCEVTADEVYKIITRSYCECKLYVLSEQMPIERLESALKLASSYIQPHLEVTRGG